MTIRWRGRTLVLAGAGLVALTVPLGGTLVRIGAISLSAGLARVAPALAAETITLNDVTVDAGPVIYRLPRIDVIGSGLGRQELLALFDTSAAEPPAKRLAGLSATRIGIPELTVEQPVSGGRQTVTYRDIVLAEIAAGRIGSATASGGTIAATPVGPRTAHGSFGPIAIGDLDLVLTARLYTQTAAPGERELEPAYRAFSMEKLDFVTARGARVRIDHISGRDVLARPTGTPWLEAIRILGETTDPATLPPSERAGYGDALVDVFDGFDIGTVEVSNVSIEAAAPDKLKASLARVGFSGGQDPAATIEGIDLDLRGSKAHLGSVSFSGFSFKPTLLALRDVLHSAATPADIDPRRLIPIIGTVKAADFALDVPNDRSAGGRLALGLRRFDVAADKPLNGVPTVLRGALAGLTFTIPTGAREAGLKGLLDIGYNSLDLAMVVDGAWNERGQEFVVRELSVSGAGMGSAALSATLGNVTADVFSSDSTVAQIALVGATAKTLGLMVEDQGLVDRLITQAARAQGRRPDELRQEIGLGAAIAIPTLLGNSRGVKDLGQAVARFVAKPGHLAITLKSRDAVGLGLTDFVASGGDLPDMFDRLDVSASAR